MLKIATRHHGHAIVLDLEGQIHAGGSAERLVDKVNSLVFQDYRQIVLNFASVTGVDSAGFGALLSAQRTVAQAGGQLTLIRVMKRIQSMLIIVGLITHFHLADGEEEAAIRDEQEVAVAS